MSGLKVLCMQCTSQHWHSIIMKTLEIKYSLQRQCFCHKLRVCSLFSELAKFICQHCVLVVMLGIATDMRYNSYQDSEPPIQQLNDMYCGTIRPQNISPTIAICDTIVYRDSYS